MNDSGDGYPPGTNYKPASQRPGYRSEAQRREAKHAKTLAEIQKSFPPDMIRGKPIDYDSYGLPTNIPDPGPEMNTQEKIKAAMAEGEMLESTPVAQQQPKAPMNPAVMAERGIPHQQPQQQTPMPQQAPQQTQPPVRAPEEFFNSPQPSRNQEPLSPPPVQPQAEPQYFAEVPLHKKPQHPVIQKLLSRFGLKKTERYDLDVFTEDSADKIKYTMTLLPDELNTWALSEAQKKAVEIGETAIGVYFEHLVVCSAVIAIDGIPLWRVFDIKPQSWEAEDLVEDPLNIPIRMRKLCGFALADILWSETRPVTEKLSDFYQNKILNRRKVTSSFDEENENTYRYICIQDSCSTVEILKPEVKADGTEQNFFCKYCGGPLVKAADLQQEKSVPLD